MLELKDTKDFALNMRNSIGDVLADLDSLNIGIAKDRLKILVIQATQMVDNINRSTKDNPDVEKTHRCST